MSFVAEVDALLMINRGDELIRKTGLIADAAASKS